MEKTHNEKLKDIIMSSDTINLVLKRARQLDLNQYYVGAGCITQTVWNYLFNYPLDYGIKDIDLVYFDDINLDFESENIIIMKAKQLFSDKKINLDIKNQARIHLWYKEHFGYSIKSYTSLESAIDTWPTTASAIGVRLDDNDELRIYAPFGLDDLFDKIIRPNKIQITKEIYEKKVSSWLGKWADLVVIPWE